MPWGTTFTSRSRLPASLGVLLALAAAACDDLRIPRAPATVPDQPAPEAAVPARPRPARATADSGAPTDSELFDQIRSGLRRLVAAEETFYAETGAYSEDLSRIGFAPPGETAVRLLWLTRDGWAASGTHPGMPGRDCVIFIGRTNAPPTTLKYVRSGREAVPVCDSPPPVPASRRTAAAAATELPGPADTASALDAVNPSVQIRVDLRNLARSQEAYYGTQGIYSKRTEPFMLQYLWHRGVTIRILSATRDGWSAKATHRVQPDKSCVIWFGTVPAQPATDVQQRVADRPSEPVCDD